jgi:hypothetical protein
MSNRKVMDLPVEKTTALIAVHNQTVQALGAQGVIPHYCSPFTATGAARELVSTTDASDLATSKTLAKALALALIAHGADTDAHSTADTIAIAAWASAPAEPADLTEVQNVLNEVKADFNTHIANATPHRGVGGQGKTAVTVVISTTDASNQGTANTLANAIKVALNAHDRAGIQAIDLVAS